MEMGPKENALRTIRFDGPQWVMDGLPEYRLSYHGCNHEGFDDDMGDSHPVGAVWVDVWSTRWHKLQEGVMGLPEGTPISTSDLLADYVWPDPDDERLVGAIYQRASEFPGGEMVLSGSHRDTLWEKAYMLVGMERMMEYFYTEPDFAREVLHSIMDFQLGIAAHYAKAGVELVHMTDDLGSQMGPLLGPKVVDRFFLPEYERLFRFYKERAILIDFHCCGNVDSVLEPLMALGVDILNPVQATANDLDAVRAATQGRMALSGAVSSSTVMDGPPERIEHEVRERMWQLGREGGYFCTPDQGMNYPPEHLDAWRAAVAKYGRYPLQPPEAWQG
jgi:uroporphyrinogen decarboxylase